MFMTTKTLTIMEDAYKLLANNKLGNESFSEEIRRILTKKKRGDLMQFFGILSKKEGEAMKKDLERIRKEQIKLTQERIKRLS